MKETRTEVAYKTASLQALHPTPLAGAALSWDTAMCVQALTLRGERSSLVVQIQPLTPAGAPDSVQGC